MREFDFVREHQVPGAVKAGSRDAAKFIAGGTNLVDLMKCDVERPAQVKLKYLDLEGKPREVEANGLFATCLQHEIDHLNGVLFIDHLSKLKRDRVLKKFTKAAKRAAV